MTAIDPPAEYQAARGRIVELVRDLPDGDLDRPVPATPAWRVRDLVSHLAGVASDVVAGNVDGAGGDEWTAVHVEARRGRSLAEVLDEWARYSGDLERKLGELPGRWPFVLVADVASHEHDLRGALGRPGGRDAPLVRALAAMFVDGIGRRLDKAGAASLRVVAGGRELVAGEGEPGATVTVPDEFELLRGLTGRRTEDELRAWSWDGDPGPYLPVLSIFPFPPGTLAE